MDGQMMDVEQSGTSLQIPCTQLPQLDGTNRFNKRPITHAGGCRHGSCSCGCLCSCACECIQKHHPFCACTPIEARLGSFIAGRLSPQMPAHIQKDLGFGCQGNQSFTPPSVSAELNGAPVTLLPTPSPAPQVYAGGFARKRCSDEAAPPWALASFYNAPQKKRAVHDSRLAWWC